MVPPRHDSITRQTETATHTERVLYLSWHLAGKFAFFLSQQLHEFSNHIIFTSIPLTLSPKWVWSVSVSKLQTAKRFRPTINIVSTIWCWIYMFGYLKLLLHIAIFQSRLKFKFTHSTTIKFCRLFMVLALLTHWTLGSGFHSMILRLIIQNKSMTTCCGCHKTELIRRQYRF